MENIIFIFYDGFFNFPFIQYIYTRARARVDRKYPLQGEPSTAHIAFCEYIGIYVCSVWGRIVPLAARVRGAETACSHHNNRDLFNEPGFGTWLLHLYNSTHTTTDEQAKKITQTNAKWK